MLPERYKDEILADYLRRLSNDQRAALARGRRAAVEDIANKLCEEIKAKVDQIANNRSFGVVGEIEVALKHILIPLDVYTNKIYDSSLEMLKNSFDETIITVNKQTEKYGVQVSMEQTPFSKILVLNIIRY